MSETSAAGPSTPVLVDPAVPTRDDPAGRLGDLTLLDERRLRRRLKGARRISDQAKRARAVEDVNRQITAARARLARRRAAVPALRFPPELPVSDRVDDIAAAIAGNQVVIVAGETGSGKSTQIPKICLQMGRGVRGTIGHTQPRRIAARALAERIAEETGTSVGGAVGYAIRFGDHTGPDTLVKLMTDGILLNEITRDRLLLGYDTIIIDEAHERSLNIDFLLGYLKELLPRRPDLKLIITSATIDPQRFSRHFGDAPIVEVSGRTYPVEIRYRPYGVDDQSESDPEDAPSEADDPPAARRRVAAGPGARSSGGSAAARAREDAIDQAQAICAAADELTAAGDGDILVFLSGEREITDTAEVLRGHLAGRRGVTEVLPLYGRLSSADQHKVFSAHTGRRIVLATNVAETSLTVPGIRYVIDPGTARISRYSPRSKVQRLPIEAISQASAGQRAGRCGRVANGICIRLYSEDDFLSRPAYTDPEIARTSLASVILQMAWLDLGDISVFPFLDPPDRRQITDGVTVLTELGALVQVGTDHPRLTPVGRSMAGLPLDPRLARILIEGHQQECLRDVLIIVAALAIVDVREYPLEERDKAVAAHSRFVDPQSDFSALLGLWAYLEDQATALSGNAFRKMCRREYLNYLRIREWQDLHAQLRQLLRGLKMDPDARPARADPARSATSGGKQLTKAPAATPVQGGQPAKGGRGSLAIEVDTPRVHTALLAGLLSHIGLRKEPGREYQGTRGVNFVIWPGSALARSGPQLVVAAELVETSRLWGRICARVEPGWIEQVAGDLLRRSYSEPRWNAKRASVEATEKVQLLGVPIVAARTVQFDRIDPELSRELFIRHALVERDWTTRHAFFAQNQRALDDVAAWEERTRRRDIVVDDETLFALYDARIPPEVTSGRHFDSWWKKASRATPNLLTFSTEMLIAAGTERFDAAAFPDRFSSGGLDLELDYVFDPGRRDDGVTVTIPLAVLARVDPSAFGRQIPGLRTDLAIALIRSLPKTLRRNFVPVPDFVRAALGRIEERGRGQGSRGQNSGADHRRDDGQAGPSTSAANAPASATASLPTELAAALTALTGVVVRPRDFDLEKVPAHLRMNFTVVDEQGRKVAAGKDLSELQSSLRTDTRQAVAKASGAVERTGLTSFPSEGLRRTVTTTVAGLEVTGYPALVDEGAAVGVTVFSTARDQARAMRAGTRRLLVLGAPSQLGPLRQSLTREQLLTMAVTPHGTVGELVSDATEAAVDALLDWAGGPAWDAAAFTALQARIRPHLTKAVRDVVVAAEQALQAAGAAARAIEAAADGPAGASIADLVGDMRQQLSASLAPGFITRSGAARIPHLTRRLQALAVRAERVSTTPTRDRERLTEVRALQSEIDRAVAGLPPERRADPDVTAASDLLQEYRVALFAQPMRTSVPVSAKRIHVAVAALRP